MNKIISKSIEENHEITISSKLIQQIIKTQTSIENFIIKQSLKIDEDLYVQQ